MKALATILAVMAATLFFMNGCVSNQQWDGAANTTGDISRLGNVGIGTTEPGDNKLAVNGKIRAKEVVVETGWSDFVFEDNYILMTLENVESYIEENKHLPDIPSAKEIEENGISLGKSQALLLQKIEELTLHIIEQNKRIYKLEQEVEAAKRKYGGGSK